MSYFTRKNLLTAFVVALIVINITALLVILLKPDFLIPHDEKPYCSHRHPRDFFIEELGLSEAQAAQFDSLRDQHRNTVRKLSEFMKKTRQQISTEMMKEHPDSALLFAKTDELGKVYAEIRKLNILHYWQMKNLCHGTQKQKLDSLFHKIFCCENMGCTPPPEKDCMKRKPFCGEHEKPVNKRYHHF